TLALCGHIFYQQCLKKNLVDGESSCPYDSCNKDIETFLSPDLFNGTSSMTALMNVDINDEALTEESGLPNNSRDIAPEEQSVAYVSSKSTGDHTSSTTQKKRSRKDSNESFASTSSKKIKKTVDRDIKELSTADPGNEEILLTKPTPRPNSDSNIFLNLYNKIIDVAKDEALRKRTERARKVYGLFSSIDVNADKGRAIIK
ncbi:17057_t:CDS:2, partial [Rhizophagus irregularis]